ncbi:hypothetical protein PIB30_024197 [Stylosanthes scabra]|uniref:Uncharacterized protein n=1 Tax=Stylosanthes scabra TaxID=79078 RepID=A0ABU6QB41_9FABA|nr:hypothetical protein [Stylosanthes scabra]
MHPSRPWRYRGRDHDPATCHPDSGHPHTLPLKGFACHEDDPDSWIAGSVIGDDWDPFAACDPYTDHYRERGSSPPEPDPMPWPLVNNPLPEGEEEDIAMEEELARQAGRIYIRYDGGNCWNKVRKGTTKITWVFMNYYKWFVPQFSMAPDHAIHFLWDCWQVFFQLQRGYEHAIYQSWRMRSAKRLREIMHEISNMGAPHGWIWDDLWKRLEEFWRQEDFKKLKQTNKRNRASETGGSLYTRDPPHTRPRESGWRWSWGDNQHRVRFLRGPTLGRKIKIGSTDARTTLVAYKEDLKRLKVECQAIIDAGGPEPPPIDEDALWAKYAGGRKKDRIYGKGVVPSHKYPRLFADTNDDDTATGPLDVREQVVLLNRELSQQAEAHAHKVAAVEAACSEKVRNLQSTVQAQSQEVSDLRKAYSDMYSYLSQIRSGSSASGMPKMPPPPPLARSQNPPPQPEQSSGSPKTRDDPDYV